MNGITHYTDCPACGSSRINPVMKVKDHSVSGEEFSVWECADCGLRFTQDHPDENSVWKYYKSEDYISHTETSKGLINRIYLFVRRQTLVKKRKLIQKLSGLKNGNLLDVGS